MRSPHTSSVSMLVLAVCSFAASAQVRQDPTLMQGTPVTLLLDQTVNSATARIGQRIAFEVSGDVAVHDQVLIPAGSAALGTVTQASHRRWDGRAGRLSVAIDTVRLPGGQIVPLSITADREDNGSGTVNDTIAASLLPPPVTPRALNAHRKDALIPEGTQVRAFVQRDTVIVQQTASVSNP